MPLLVTVGRKVELQMVHEVPKRHGFAKKAAMGMDRWAWPACQVWNQLRKASGACNMASLEVGASNSWVIPQLPSVIYDDLCDTQGDIPLY